MGKIIDWIKNQGIYYLLMIMAFGSTCVGTIGSGNGGNYQDVRMKANFNSHEVAKVCMPDAETDREEKGIVSFIDSSVIVTNAVLFIPEGDLYLFSLLNSDVHMAWMRMICGRLEMRFRYSKEVVYNNFPWPRPTDAQKAKIEKTAQAILDARNLYPDCSLADLYDETTMPVELRRAHQDNDKAVMEAYGFSWRDMSEADVVAELFKLYELMTSR